jgi:glycosyltransferase involved in cell wall biosynthesis
MPEEPLVSVILPCYNCEKYVEKAIVSILNQTYKNIEIIITDDCSTDNTLSIIETLAKQDKRIILIRNKSNLKIIETLNNSIDIAHGRYIARMDADDISLPKRIEKQVHFLEYHPEYAICGTNAWHINKSGRIIGTSILPYTSEEIERTKFFGNPFYHSSVMIKKDLINLSRYNSNYIHAEDYELWLSLLLEYKGANLRDRLIKYRIHGDSVCHKYKYEQNETLVNIFSKYLTYGNFDIARLYVYCFYFRIDNTSQLKLDNMLILSKNKNITNMNGYNFYVLYKYFRYFLKNKRMIVFINSLSFFEKIVFLFKLILYSGHSIIFRIHNLFLK